MKIKIFLVLLFSFLFSSFLIKNVFIANSPKVRPYLNDYFAFKIKDLFKNFSNLAFYGLSSRHATNTIIEKTPTIEGVKNKEKTPTIEGVKNKPLIPIGKGVYARTDNKNALIEINLEGVDFIEYTFTINGKEIKIKVPKGESTPNQKVLEALYK